MSLNDKQRRITLDAIRAMAQPRIAESRTYTLQRLPESAAVGDVCRLPDGTEFVYSLEGWREKRAAEKVASELAGNAVLAPNLAPAPVDPTRDTAPKAQDQQAPPER